MAGREAPDHGGSFNNAWDSNMPSICTLKNLELTQGSFVCLSATETPVAARARDGYDSRWLTRSLGCGWNISVTWASFDRHRLQSTCTSL